MSNDSQTIQGSPIVPDLVEPAPDNATVIRTDPAEDSLEKRLAWLTMEVRTASAEHAKKKRNESVLEARDYKTAAVPIATPQPKDLDLPKVTLAPSVKPSDEPHVVERNGSDAAWHFDVSDPAEVSRTLPIDPRAPIADPLPFRTATRGSTQQSPNWFVTSIAVLGGILIGTLLQRMLPIALSSEQNRVGIAHGSARIAAFRALERYEDWLTVRSLAAQWKHSRAMSQLPEESSTSTPASVAAPSGHFPPLPSSKKNPLITPRKIGSNPFERRAPHE